MYASSIGYMEDPVCIIFLIIKRFENMFKILFENMAKL